MVQPASQPKKLRVGFRFRPTDEELVAYYLKHKLLKADDPSIHDAIREINICKYDPWDLPAFSAIKSDDPEWFFFSPLDYRYSNSTRRNRATPHGYWKITGKGRKITDKAHSPIGTMKNLVFYEGRVPNGVKTNWVIHEYHDLTVPAHQRTYVLCRLKKSVKKTEGKTYELVYDESEPSSHSSLMVSEDENPEENCFSKVDSMIQTPLEAGENVNSLMETPVESSSLMVSEDENPEEHWFSTVESMIQTPLETDEHVNLLMEKDEHVNSLMETPPVSEMNSVIQTTLESDATSMIQTPFESDEFVTSLIQTSVDSNEFVNSMIQTTLNSDKLENSMFQTPLKLDESVNSISQTSCEFYKFLNSMIQTPYESCEFLDSSTEILLRSYEYDLKVLLQQSPSVDGQELLGNNTNSISALT